MSVDLFYLACRTTAQDDTRLRRVIIDTFFHHLRTGIVKNNFLFPTKSTRFRIKIAATSRVVGVNVNYKKKSNNNNGHSSTRYTDDWSK